MNRIRTLTAIAAAVLIAGCVSIAPGNDPVVVNAERTTALASDTFDSLLLWEYENRAALAAVPEIKKGADHIRTHAPAWLKTTRDLTKAYKQNRTDGNKAALETWVALLKSAIANANQYIPTKP